jgi:hypothetical protein
MGLSKRSLSSGAPPSERINAYLLRVGQVSWDWISYCENGLLKPPGLSFSTCAAFCSYVCYHHLRPSFMLWHSMRPFPDMAAQVWPLQPSDPNKLRLQDFTKTTRKKWTMIVPINIVNLLIFSYFYSESIDSKSSTVLPNSIVPQGVLGTDEPWRLMKSWWLSMTCLPYRRRASFQLLTEVLRFGLVLWTLARIQIPTCLFSQKDGELPVLWNMCWGQILSLYSDDV